MECKKHLVSSLNVIVRHGRAKTSVSPVNVAALRYKYRTVQKSTTIRFVLLMTVFIFRHWNCHCHWNTKKSDQERSRKKNRSGRTRKLSESDESRMWLSIRQLSWPSTAWRGSIRMVFVDGQKPRNHFFRVKALNYYCWSHFFPHFSSPEPGSLLHLCFSFMCFRIKIEEEYAKNLSKLSQSPLALQEEGWELQISTLTNYTTVWR